MGKDKYNVWTPFTLKDTTIVYQANGVADQKTKTIFLKAPTMRNVQYVKSIEQLFFKSMIYASKLLTDTNESTKTKSTRSKKPTISVDEVKQGIAAGNVPFMDYYDVFKEFMLSGNCCLDEEGKVLLTEDLFNQIESISDFESIVYGYIANFILPHLF